MKKLICNKIEKWLKKHALPSNKIQYITTRMLYQIADTKELNFKEFEKLIINYFVKENKYLDLCYEFIDDNQDQSCEVSKEEANYIFSNNEMLHPEKPNEKVNNPRSKIFIYFRPA